MIDKREQHEADAEVQRERKERGQLREDYLEAGRQLAMEENQARSEAEGAPSEEKAIPAVEVQPVNVDA